MRALRRVASRFRIAGELLGFYASARWWMVPLLVVLLVTGAVLVLAESSVLGPFIYALF